ncbi:Na+/H+ antiporter NhaC family protein [Garciella nitratireducens]|uniref:Transporter, NhaC family n=1 Tax=Garciella nitratireducens DSM 15102 TaxID=1121911 RepID=A0A1T4KJK3_9FIRM|nr:transporter (NhaC family) [Garciella nitratireducens]SJZ42555.1 transporter, NhaC family [Garciella nitratireducens DSM 15102]
MKKKGIVLFLVFIFLSNNIVFAAEMGQTSGLGWISLLPPIISIILAFITKNVVFSLFLGIFSGTFILQIQDGNAFIAFFKAFLDIVDYILSSLSDSWNAGIILQVLTIGGLIGLISKMGGAKAVAETLSRKAKGPVSAQVITWILGIFVFFDDYANSLIVGPIMRPVTDKMKVSREKLSFIVDATAAPISGVALVSTWVGYEIGLIKDAYGSIGQSVNAYAIFLDSIPYRFYNILMLLFVVCTAFFLREFGPMYKAELRARKYNKIIADGANPMVADDIENLEPIEGKKLNIWNALIPIGALIISAFLGFYFNGSEIIMGGENIDLIELLERDPLSFTAVREAFGASDASVVLFQSALISSIIALVMGVVQRIFTISEGIDIWVQGMKSLVITGVILLLAWSLSNVIGELGTAEFLVSLLSNTMPAFLLPSIIFILGAIISFATGTSYGTMGILMPLAIPLAAALSSDTDFIVMSAGAVLTGAIFGDHCSPISDTSILSSMGAASDHVDHVKTQLPYAIMVAIISIIFGYIPVGLGFPIWFILPLSVIITILVVRFIGKPVKINE